MAFDDPDKLLVEAEITDNRTQLLKLQERKGVKANPFLLAGMIFFSALITVVVLIFIFIFLFLKQAFSGMSSVF
jgi:hypothetical protein